MESKKALRNPSKVLRTYFFPKAASQETPIKTLARDATPINCTLVDKRKNQSSLVPPCIHMPCYRISLMKSAASTSSTTLLTCPLV